MAEETPPRWLTIYGGWAAWCLQRRKTTSPRPVSSSSARSPGPLLPTGFLPPDDLSQTQVYLSLQPGSTFRETFAAAEQARHIVERDAASSSSYTAVGGGKAGSDPFTPASRGRECARRR